MGWERRAGGGYCSLGPGEGWGPLSRCLGLVSGWEELLVLGTPDRPSRCSSKCRSGED